MLVVTTLPNPAHSRTLYRNTIYFERWELLMAGSERVTRAPTGEVTIRVLNEGAAWVLECRPGFETLIFSCSESAQATGEALATRFACAGRGVQMAIENGGHAVVATRTFFPLLDTESLASESKTEIAHL